MTRIGRRLMVVVAIVAAASASGCRVLESACEVGADVALGIAKAALASKVQDLEPGAAPEADPPETRGDGPPLGGRTPVPYDRTADVSRGTSSRRDPGK